MTPLITLRHGHFEIILILLHLYCLLNYVNPPSSINNGVSTLLQTLHESLRYYIPQIYPIIFEILSFPYTSDSGKNMKFIKFQNPDVFSVAYALVAPITMHHVWEFWMWVMGIWGFIGPCNPSNGLFPLTSHFNESLLAWLGAICITIYTTIPAILLVANMAGNICESMLEISTRFLKKEGQGEWDKLYWFRLKWGRTWGTNVFWWWEGNPIRLVFKFKDEMKLFLLRPRGLDQGPMLLPTTNSMMRSKTTLDINTARRAYRGFSKSCRDLTQLNGRPALQQRQTGGKEVGSSYF